MILRTQQGFQIFLKINFHKFEEFLIKYQHYFKIDHPKCLFTLFFILFTLFLLGHLKYY